MNQVQRNINLLIFLVIISFFNVKSLDENDNYCNEDDIECNKIYLNENINNNELQISENSTKALKNNFSHYNRFFKNEPGLELSNFLQRNTKEKQLRAALKNIIFKYTNVFNASQSPQASHKCRIDMEKYLNGVQNLELWALKMHDASARLSSGILNGNINQLGDFDQCLSPQSPSSNNFRSQYCLAYMQPTLTENYPFLTELFNLVQSHKLFKNDFNDPGHRVPRFSFINWGVCVPSSCTPKNVEYSLNKYMNNITKDFGISLQIRIENEMCQTSKPITLDRNTLAAIIFFAFIILAAIFSTFYDCSTDRQLQNEWLSTFSLRRNIRWLFNTRSSPEDIRVIHGIRFFNAFMLLMAHKSLATIFVPYVNRTQMAESLGQSWTVIGRAASLYTDPFLLLSGMLTAYSLIGRLQKKQPIKLKDEYAARFLRIVPPLFALILFCTFVLPLLGSGPLWNLVIGHHAKLCKKNWWRNLLFIHNYFGFSNMCLTHTHHLGIDTQLFVVAPLMILLIWKWPKRGLHILLALAGFATAARFYTTMVNELSNYVYFGTTIKRLFKTADYMYSFPPYRSTVYIQGLLLGYLLRIYKDKKLTTQQLRWGWTISTICFLISFFAVAPMGDINYKYNPLHAALYAAFAPIAWCLYFSWIIFVSYLGYKNKLIKILSWKGFQITTKLSYALYLTQFPVFFFNVGRHRHSDYYRFIPLTVNLNEILCIILVSITLVLLFEAPFLNIKKLIFKKSTIKKVIETTSTTQNKRINDEVTSHSHKDIKEN